MVVVLVIVCWVGVSFVMAPIIGAMLRLSAQPIPVYTRRTPPPRTEYLAA